MKEKDMEYFYWFYVWIIVFLFYEKFKYVIIILVEYGEGGLKLGGLLVKMSNKFYEFGYF